MPTDHVTTNITADDPPDPGLMTLPWAQRPFIDWGAEMASRSQPRTPQAPGTSPRPQIGLVFPR